MSPTCTRIRYSSETHKADPRQVSVMATLDRPDQEELSPGRSNVLDFSLRPRVANHSYNLRGSKAPSSPVHAYKSTTLPLTKCPCEHPESGTERKDEGAYQDARAETALLASIGTPRKGSAPALRDLRLRRSTSAHVIVLGSKSKLHWCDFEGCDRFFKRLEHKRRHERLVRFPSIFHLSEGDLLWLVLLSGRTLRRNHLLAIYQAVDASSPEVITLPSMYDKSPVYEAWLF